MLLPYILPITPSTSAAPFTSPLTAPTKPFERNLKHVKCSLPSSTRFFINSNPTVSKPAVQGGSFPSGRAITLRPSWKSWIVRSHFPRAIIYFSAEHIRNVNSAIDLKQSLWLHKQIGNLNNTASNLIEKDKDNHRSKMWRKKMNQVLHLIGFVLKIKLGALSEIYFWILNAAVRRWFA